MSSVIFGMTLSSILEAVLYETCLIIFAPTLKTCRCLYQIPMWLAHSTLQHNLFLKNF